MAEMIVELPDGRKMRVFGPSIQAIEEKVRTMIGGEASGIPTMVDGEAAFGGHDLGGNLAATGRLVRDKSGRVVDNVPGAIMPPKNKTSSTTALAGAAAERMLDNVVGIPDVLARAGGGLRNLGRAAVGQDMVPQVPGSFFPDMPSGREIMAGAQGLLGSGRESALADRNEIAEEHPVADMFGGLLGDVGTIVTGRAPLVRGPGGLLDGPMDHASTVVRNYLARSKTSTGVQAAASRIASDDMFPMVMRAMGRAGETGLEAAALSTIQGGDPLEVAAFAAGGQALASGALYGAQGVVELPADAFGIAKPKTLIGKAGAVGISALVIGHLAQTALTAAPGVDPWRRTTEEFGFDKVTANLLLAATLGALGKRTKPEGVLAQFPVAADVILTLPRTMIIKAAQELSDDRSLQRPIDMLIKGEMPAHIAESFADGINNGELGKTHRDKYENDKEYRELMDAPHPKLIGVPLREAN